MQTVHRFMRATLGVKGLNPKEWDRICSMHEKIRSSKKSANQRSYWQCP